MHVHRRMLAAPVLAATALIMGTVAVFAHNVTSVQGTAACNGTYSITATGDVYGGHFLKVTLNGSVIVNVAENGSQANNPSGTVYGPFTGTGASVGDAITAQAFNIDKQGNETTAEGNLAKSTLTGAGGDCTQPSVGYSTTCAVPGTAQGGALIITFGGNSWPDASGTHPNSIRVDGGSAQAVTSTTSTTGPYSVGNHSFTTQPQGVEPVNGEDGWPFKISACAVPTPTPTPRPTPTPSGPPVPITGANDTGFSTGQLVLGGGLAIVAASLFGMAIRARRREDI